MSRQTTRRSSENVVELWWCRQQCELGRGKCRAPGNGSPALGLGGARWPAPNGGSCDTRLWTPATTSEAMMGQSWCPPWVGQARRAMCRPPPPPHVNVCVVALYVGSRGCTLVPFTTWPPLLPPKTEYFVSQIMARIYFLSVNFIFFPLQNLGPRDGAQILLALRVAPLAQPPGPHSPTHHNTCRTVQDISHALGCGHRPTGK